MKNWDYLRLNVSSMLPVIMNRVGPLRTKDAINAMHRAINSFLVASGCFHVNKLECK